VRSMCHQHQDEDEHDGSDQTGQENGTTKRRRENDLSAAGLFSRIWFLIHDAAPFRDSKLELCVGSAKLGSRLTA
jgi:hypothetical protein